MKTSPSTDNCRELRIALFAGSFDPFTLGHENIVRRGLEIFDQVIVGIGINPDKHPMMSAEARKQWIEEVFECEPRVKVIAYEGYTVDAARANGAKFLLRGVRTAADFEYEKNIAAINRRLAGIETVLINTLPHLEHISSSLVRERLAQGQDISDLIPTNAPKHLL
ncbi:MAG: pantetheine-phosphate adenylyltransferase [Muribaculaceae bacterium]|nr:pantetheine-phosphate adenylyltransferase [Muribaculaceae bacterium]